MKKKLPKLSVRAKKAWDLMSIISRQKDAYINGMTPCITCGQVKHWKEMHAGHFFHASKQHPITYDDRNIHAQCPRCNTYKGGARDHYSVQIVRRYGPGTLAELEHIKHQGKPLRRGEIEELIDRLKIKVDGTE